MRPQGLCLPIISMAARLSLDDDTITAASISMGPVGPVPWFAEPVAEVLVGGPPTEEQFKKAADAALEEHQRCAPASTARPRSTARR